VGKTTTAAQRARAEVRLDSKAVLEVVSAQPETILTRARPLLVDEWQRVPEVWDVIRRQVDQDRTGGQFLLTGSATPRPGATAHSGAGRIGRLRMRPMTLTERGAAASGGISLAGLLAGGQADLDGTSDARLADYASHIVSSGFPGMAGLTGRALRFELDSYLLNAVDRDVPELGKRVRRRGALMDWLRAYAAATSSTASYSHILNAAAAGQADKLARSTAVAYQDTLADIWLTDPVPAWGPVANPAARLGRTPKHQLADPALAARLLGLGVDALLDGQGRPLGPQAGTMLGRLFEALATLCVRVAASAAEARVSHLRTRDGDHEVDLVVERADGMCLPIEVKLSAAVADRDTRHLRWFRERYADLALDAIVLNTGPHAYRRADGVGVVPLALLAP
jgi:predicted AAA+ superfamily ATPase